MDLKIYISAIVCSFTGFICAQDSIPDVLYDSKTDYKQFFINRITTRLFYNNTSNELKVNDRNSDLFFDLVPNKQDRIGASVAFRSISISYGFTPNFLSENKDNEDSKLSNFGIRTYFGDHWMQAIELHTAKGFYIRNDDVNAYFPAIKSFKIGGATSYIFNKKFSFRAIVSQDEKQLKSVGSFIPRIVYYYSKFTIKSDETDSNLFSCDIAFAPSYYYNFVPSKNLFISAGVSAGIGLNHSKDDESDLTSMLTELNFRSSATYDINSFYVGVHYNYLVLNHNTDRSSYVKDGIPFLEIFVAYRFRAPKKLVQKADDVNKKLKLKS